MTRHLFQIPPFILSNMENIEIPKSLKTGFQNTSPWVPLENDRTTQQQTTRNIRPEDYAETRNTDI